MERIEFHQGFADAEGNNKGSGRTPTTLWYPERDPPRGDPFCDRRPHHEVTVREFGYPNVQTVEISQAGMEQCLDNDVMTTGATMDAAPIYLEDHEQITHSAW